MSTQPPARHRSADLGPASGAAPTLPQAPGGVASLICGVLGITFVPLICPTLALVFGYQSKEATAREPHRFNDAYGQAGRILGWVGTAFSVIAVIVLIRFVAGVWRDLMLL